MSFIEITNLSNGGCGLGAIVSWDGFKGVSLLLGKVVVNIGTKEKPPQKKPAQKKSDPQIDIMQRPEFLSEIYRTPRTPSGVN